MQNHTRLDDLLARDAGPRWFEGVAVVQLICRQLREQGAKIAGFPSAADILIGPGGSVRIAGESSANPVQAAAHVLALMLSDDVPVRLRLVVSQATATEAGYASLAEFSEALTYFERPGPESIVDGFRQRALMAGPREIPVLTRIDPPPVNEKDSAVAPAAPPRRGGRLAVVAATVLTLVCASVWLIGGSGHQLLSAKLAIAERAEAAVPAEQPPAKERTNSATPARHRVTVAHISTPGAEPSPGALRFAYEPIPELQVGAEWVSYRYSALPLLPPAGGAAESRQTDLDVPASSTTGDAAADERSDRIYSRADPEVTLPLNIYPKFPTEPAVVDVTGPTILELTIATDGLVERVRMLTAPRNIHEFMLLSAAKAWRFEPASIGGRPVRFRHTMALIPMR